MPRDPTPFEMVTQREAECLDLLSKLVGVVTVRLWPSAFAIFADAGYGAEMVNCAVDALTRAGLAEVRWDVHGAERVPCLRAA